MNTIFTGRARRSARADIVTDMHAGLHGCDGARGATRPTHKNAILVAFLCSLCCLLFNPGSANAAQLTINVGTTNNDGTGDTLRSAFQKVNTNFNTIFAGLIYGTNTLQFSNICTVVQNADTNRIIVSGAGQPGVNGVYIQGNPGIYNLTNATLGIYYDGFAWSLTNAAQDILYFADITFTDTPVSAVAWALGSGAAPGPVSAYGAVTNCVTVLAASGGFDLPVLSTNLYLDATLGNDSTAVRGRPDRPWRHLQVALLSQRPGDTLYLGPGTFPDLGPYGQYFYVSNNVRIVGAGRGLTTVGTSNLAEERIICSSGTVLRDFTLHGALWIGHETTTNIATNCIVERLQVFGVADAIKVNRFEQMLTVSDCWLDSPFDVMADWECRPGGSNRVIRFYNSILRGAYNGNSTRVHGIDGGDNRIEMFGGSIEAFHGPTHNQCVRLDVDGVRTNKTGSVLLSNVRLRHQSTNGLSLMVSNFYNLPIFLDNCTEEVVTGPLTSGSFTNQWWHRNIALGNGSARTNRLVDVTSLTNALAAISEQGHRVTISDDLRTASGTNLYIYPHGTQKINGVLSYTNITADGGSMTLMIRSNGWQIISSFP